MLVNVRFEHLQMPMIGEVHPATSSDNSSRLAVVHAVGQTVAAVSFAKIQSVNSTSVNLQTFECGSPATNRSSQGLQKWNVGLPPTNRGDRI